MAANGCYICAPLVAQTVESMLSQAQQAKDAGASLVELRLDHLTDFRAEKDLQRLLEDRVLPVIVTYRPHWEGGQYKGEEPPRLATLRRAVKLGAEYVDIELQAAQQFLSSRPSSQTQVIVSNHNYEKTPSSEELAATAEKMLAVGADVVKLATTATDISDVARLLALIGRLQVPAIALAMGPSGLISRLLAPKFGALLTFGALSAGQESAPGQPTVRDLANVYAIQRQNVDTKVYGVIGNPVMHSKGPLLHNAAMREVGFNGVYVPYLVDNLRQFLDTYDGPDFAGFSVTIPHKEEALQCCDEIDPVAKAIGAVNTLVRRPDGKLVGYNTDWSAAITAIEEGLQRREGKAGAASVLQNKTVVVVGAGGAGRALAFGAKERGAHVIIANRTLAKAESLAEAVGGVAVPWEDLLGGKVRGDVLANSTAVGMQPKDHETPVPKEALAGYSVVFDAVYTPMETRLLREGKEMGATAVSGVEMFVGQAADQFELFTGKTAPRELMARVVLDSLQAK